MGQSALLRRVFECRYISSDQLSLSPRLRASSFLFFFRAQKSAARLQQLSAALQPRSPSPEHWPAGDNISKGVVIATHYIIIISDPSPFTPTAE